MKKGILLINIGTPDQPDTKSVRRYLKEFLSDPRVIDISAIARWLLVNLFVLPFRSRKSAALYQKIWYKQGSPLLVHTKLLRSSLAKELGSDYKVVFGMRYGQPTIASALANLKDCSSLNVIPLFPQYSSAATGSAIEKTLQVLQSNWNMPAIKIINEFYAHPGFISSYAELIKQSLAEKKVDMLLFSYHGVPERHIDKSKCVAACDHLHACPSITDDNQYCYRAQCHATSDLIAKELNLSPVLYRVAFQSRLGRTPWIKPYTDLLLPELIKSGVKSIAVVSPSFVVDCLETLEEINIRMREQWKVLGGEEFVFIPCLNHSALWVKGLAGMVN
ncbi:MAG: ferrochelatase [Gammaproteobacteria bacterium]